MKIKQTMRYKLNEYFRSSLIFYIVIAVLFITTLILRSVLNAKYINMGGMESASMIFVFVLGLNSFKQEFGLFTQNGISRKSLWVNFLACAMLVSIAMSLINSLFPVLFGKTLGYTSIFNNQYRPFLKESFSIVGLVWNVMSHFSLMCVGFFITTLYYRMNKALKVIVSVGIPALFFVILPVVEVFVPSFNLFSSLLKFYTWAMGLSFTVADTVPWRAVGSMAVLSCVTAGLGFLLIRRATLKES